MTKIGMISLGCAKNLVDSEIILGMLKSSNYELVNSLEESEVVIINTCGFIESSKQESIDNILDVISYHKKTVVVGCLVERYLDELKKAIPEVDLWVRIKDYSTLNEKLEELINEKKPIEKFNPFVRLLSTPPFMAYLRISEGCNNCCTYCAIPLIRGHFRSRPFADVLKEARMLADNGIKELVLISQDTTRYGSDFKDKVTVVDLLAEILKIKEFYSIRLLYLYPDEISDELIDLIAKNPRISPYFDIPFQHSSDSLLKRMNRRGTRKEYEELITKIREKIPHAILRTTYIVGFPGETDSDMADLVSFTKKMRFDHMGAFTYSREDGTVSYDFIDQIPEETKKARYDEIMSVQKTISYENNKSHIDEVMEGIVLSYNAKAKQYSLRSYWNAPDDIDGNILFKSNKSHNVGDIVKVKITSAFIYDLYGEEVE